MANTIRLYNKGKRAITGVHTDVLDAEGKPKPFSFGGGQSGEFHVDVANNLRKLYPNEIVSLDDVKRQFDDNSINKPMTPTAPVITVAQAELEKQKAIEEALAKQREEIFSGAAAESPAPAEIAEEKQEAPAKKQVGKGKKA